MTTRRKPDGTVTSSIMETMNTMLDHLITDDREEENQHHKNKENDMNQSIPATTQNLFKQK